MTGKQTLAIARYTHGPVIKDSTALQLRNNDPHFFLQVLEVFIIMGIEILDLILIIFGMKNPSSISFL